jgi:hypothetical protein
MIVHGIAHDRAQWSDFHPAAPDAFCKIKRLGAETYVTNKASATPLRNYAPQSRLKCFASFDFGR